jgi:hypothetical protein
MKQQKYAVYFALLLLIALSGLGLWSKTSGQAPPTYTELWQNRSDDPYNLAWNPQGTMLAISEGEGIGFYTDQLQKIGALTIDQNLFGLIWGIRWNQAGTQLAIALSRLDVERVENVLQIWDVETKTLLRTLDCERTIPPL